MIMTPHRIYWSIVGTVVLAFASGGYLLVYPIFDTMQLVREIRSLGGRASYQYATPPWVPPKYMHHIPKQCYVYPRITWLSFTESMSPPANRSRLYQRLARQELLGAVCFSSPWMSDSDVEQLKSSVRLHRLVLDSPQFTDEIFRTLKRFISPRHFDLNLRGTRISDQGVLQLSQMATTSGMTNLDLSQTEISDSSVLQLGAFSKLVDLKLGGTRVSDRGANHALNLRLKSLDLSETQITDDALMRLLDVSSLQYLKLGKTRITDQGIAHLAPLAKLSSLDISQTDVTADGLCYLTQLPQLGVLNLSGLPIHDHDLKMLLSMRIRWLYLQNTPITDEGLKTLARLKSLESLDLTGTQVTNEGLKNLLEESKLSRLHLGQTKVTPEICQYLQGKQNVKVLDLGLTELTDEWIDGLGLLQHLTELVLSNSSITGDNLSFLKQMKSLRRIDLSHTNLDDTGLSHLYGIEQPFYIGLKRTNVSATGVSELRRQLDNNRNRKAKTNRPSDIKEYFDVIDWSRK